MLVCHCHSGGTGQKGWALHKMSAFRNHPRVSAECLGIAVMRCCAWFRLAPPVSVREGVCGMCHWSGTFLALCVVDRVVARWKFLGIYRSRWAASDLYCPSRPLGVAVHDTGWLQKPGANVRRKKPRKNGTKQRGRSARGRACKPAALPHMLPTTAVPACAMAPPATPSGIVWHAECVVPL